MNLEKRKLTKTELRETLIALGTRIEQAGVNDRQLVKNIMRFCHLENKYFATHN